MSLRLSDLPAPWRQPAGLLLFVALVLGGGWATVLIVRSLARAEAQEVVREDREQFKADALAAARAGAKEAVRETVDPVLLELRAHDAWDRRAQDDNERRLDRLETREQRR